MQADDQKSGSNRQDPDMESPVNKLPDRDPETNIDTGPDSISAEPADTAKPLLYTIGHSNYPVEQFLALLAAFKIELLVDIRRFAGSRKWPQYGQEQLRVHLKKAGIHYLHMESLGGRRKLNKASRNTNWRHPSFRAYADYMETPAFEEAVQALEVLARKQTTAIMCSEVLWWRCHRALVSDYLKARGWTVYHIMGPHTITLHPYTSVAKIINGQLRYR